MVSNRSVRDTCSVHDLMYPIRFRVHRQILEKVDDVIPFERASENMEQRGVDADGLPWVIYVRFVPLVRFFDRAVPILTAICSEWDTVRPDECIAPENNPKYAWAA